MIFPSPTPAFGIGSTRVSEKDGMVMFFVSKGQFTMGYNKGDIDEKPERQVWLDAFWIDQTEVTNKVF
jgi:eukaryotic-like serine/threonine-protein kinase